MKIKWWYVVLTLSVLASCNKKGNVQPVKKPDTIFQNTIFSLNSLLQNNMVVQRDKPFLIWGKAPAKLKIAVNVSWNLTTFSAVADASGNWQVSITATATNSSPQTIIAKADGSADITLTNILIGDVWVCSGQSNMVMPVDSIAPFRGVLNYPAEIAAANYPFIRIITPPLDREANPLLTLNFPARWTVCSPSTVGNISAIAYYFARKLNTTLNVPIGIIISADNGSYCQDWTNAEAIKNDPLLQQIYSGGSSTLYNGMINPLTHLAIKGFTWYQGENNEHDSPPSNYTRLNSALIRGWRTKFNQADLPFYYVQMTPFDEDYNKTTPPGGLLNAVWYAKFREAQANIRALGGTGMAVTMDVGEVINHHPRNKKPVGERLALLALNYTYNQPVQCVGPQYASFSVSGYSATVNYVSGTAGGLNTIDNGPLNQFFFVAGTDHVFRPGNASIKGNTVSIIAPSNTPLPIQAVRYAFTTAPVTNLQNSAGLPAEPFRTDNWSN